MKSTKMHGIGSDHVYMNCFEKTVSCPEGVSKRISDRHFGIGSDGLILIKSSEVTDCRMWMFSTDDSGGVMCGNAIRYVGKYVYEYGTVKKASISVETRSGPRFLELDMKGSEVVSVAVDMRESELTSRLPEPTAVDGVDYKFVGTSMGDPHVVYFTEEINGLDLEKIGPAFRHHVRFPERTNTESTQLVDRNHTCMRVWERGSGETWVCGAGASVNMTVSILTEYTDRKVEVFLCGRKLIIHRDEENNHIFMTRPAVEAFHGEAEI